MLRLSGRTGDFEIPVVDGFYLAQSEVSRLPRSWQKQCSEPDRGYVEVAWPEKHRGSRIGRLIHFNREVFEPAGVHPLEADIDPAQRWLAENPKVQLASDWRILFYDVETEQITDWEKPWLSRILAFSWRSSSGKRGHVVLKERNDRAEFELLSTFASLAAKHDILSAWNGERFDDRVVLGRMEILGVPFDRTTVHWLDHLKLFRKYYLRSEDGGVTSSFALEAVGGALLGERKVPIKERAKALGWDGKGDLFVWVWKNAPELLAEYNDQDCSLMQRLEEKTQFLQLHLALCRICRVLPGSHSIFPMTLVDGKMLQRGHEAGYHFPSRIYHDDRDDEDDRKKDNIERARQAKGAYVPEAVPGLHESVAVVDYARMYVSFIRSFNISLETLDPDGDIAVPETDEKGRPTGKILARFRSDPIGHIPAALTDGIEARKRYKELRAQEEVGSPKWHDYDRLDNALKVYGNIFYGVVLAPNSRYHVQVIGESITSIGRFFLAKTYALVEQRGHKPIAGDTDSTFFTATDEQALAIKREVNEIMIPSVLDANGVIRPDVAIDYEKRFARVVFSASKKYAGRFALYKGKPADPKAPIEVRGLEIVRSDVCKAARDLQRMILEEMLDLSKKPTPEASIVILERERERLLSGEVPSSDLVFAKGLTKKVSEYRTEKTKGAHTYAVTPPPHVRVAKRMQARGESAEQGSKIPYVFTSDQPVHPEEKEAAEIDLELYWNKYVYPPSMRVLAAAFPSVDWEHFLAAVPHKAHPDQGVLFTREPRRTARRIEKPSAIQISVGEQIDIKRLKQLLLAFPGEIPVEVHMSVPHAVVELQTTFTARRPDSDTRFIQGLRALGATWV